MSLLAQAGDMADFLTRVRHDLHAHPEVGLDLPRTQQTVLESLSDLPVEVVAGKAATSVTAVLHGQADRPGRPVVLLRADMDAVPVPEETGLPYASRVEGVMHACGHDMHTAMLLGAARLLTRHRDRLAADVVLMFQPGEEGWEGAQLMIDEGVLEAAGRRPDVAFALHVFSTMAPAVYTRPGPMLASSSALLVTVRGRGGHASAPHLARDPLPAAAEMVLALQTMVTRQFDVFDPVVLTVGVLNAGTRRNVIPSTAAFEATVRTFSEAAAQRAGAEAIRLVEGIAAAHGVEVEARFVRERPVTESQPAEAAYLAQTAIDVLGPHWHRALARPFTGAEDFSRVLAHVPGAFAAVGALPPGLPADRAAFNHSSRAIFDDAVLPYGAALYAGLALRRAHLPAPVEEKDLQ